LENLERSERDREEVETRLSAMAEQVDTLEHIVGVKDEQIAALQKALAEANAANDEAAVESPVDAEVLVGSEAESMPALLEPEVEPVAEPEPEVAPAPVVEAAPAASPEEKGGLFGNMAYIIGLLAAAALALFFFMRRRSSDDNEEEASVSASNDVFADIKLEEENMEVDAHQADQEPVEAQEEEVDAPPSRSRGYGERKHDEYADDMDAGDALAEADIYIAYGRFPQALDLLKTAIENEPGNAAYKLKLMEVSAELGDQAEVMSQYAELKNMGDADILAKAEEVAKNLDEVPEAQAPLGDIEEEVTPESFDLSDELGAPASSEELNLADDFGSLEIEEFEADDEELDLSADFDVKSADPAVAPEEELVFAEDSDAMSTKLDLARAYLDMGDQDGARQIFEEVIAEGSEEQKEEARALLERLD
jgi:pilus assembly protein FimV